jgi:hypothetical protein
MRVILLSPDEALDVLDAVRDATERGLSVRVADDEGSFKVKIGYGAWSPPLGVVEVNDR